MDAVRYRVSVAVPSLHGYCLDVPAGLRACWLPCSSAWREKKSSHGLSGRATGSKPDCAESGSDASRICRQDVHDRSRDIWCLVAVLCRATGLSTDECCSPQASSYLDPLSSRAVCPDGAGQSRGRMLALRRGTATVNGDKGE